MKKLAALTVLCIFLLSCITAYAAEPRAVTARPILSFNGSTANCEVSVTAYGDIDITLSLWQGSTLIDSWSGSGFGSVSMSESCSVTKGKNYTLTVSGTAGGQTVSGSTSKYCG